MVIQSKTVDVHVHYLGEEEIWVGEEEKKKAKFYELVPDVDEEKEVSHHILLVDTSGSMAREIETLKEKVKQVLKALKSSKNHYVSIISYSGHEESYRIVNAVKCDTLSYKMAKVYECVEEQLFSRGITVMSEPLEQAITVVKGLEDVCQKHQMILFTDGCLVPSRWDIKEESRKCYEVAKVCSEKGVYLSAIGFGKYYDREFLKQLIAFGEMGQWMHIDEIKDYYQTVLGLIEKVDHSYTMDLKIHNKDWYIFGQHERMQGEKVLTYLPDKKQYIVTFEDDLLIEGKKVLSKKKKVEENFVEDLYYELALYYLLREDVDNMSYVLAKTGDLAAYENLYSIYSFAEKGQGIQRLVQLNEEPQARYKKGKVPIRVYSEGEEPLCLLEVIYAILEDENSKLLWHAAYDYKNIGVRQKEETTGYRFIRPYTGYQEVVDLSIGSKKLNIGVKVKIDGKVEEISTGFKIGASIYRDYNLVVNGNINTKEMWCELSKELVRKFRKEKLIKSVTTVKNRKIYTLNLARLKATNKRMFKTLDQQQVAKYLYDLKVLQVKLWAAKKVCEQLLKTYNKKMIDIVEEDPLLKEMKKRFRVDENGIYHPQKMERCHTLPYEVYPATVLEWKVEKFPKKKLEIEAMAFYENMVSEQGEGGIVQLNEVMNDLKQEKQQKERQVNLVRLASGLIEKTPFLWENQIEKTKVETDQILGMNSVVDGRVCVSTKTVEGIQIRQDHYTVLTRCTT